MFMKSRRLCAKILPRVWKGGVVNGPLTNPNSQFTALQSIKTNLLAFDKFDR